MFNYDTDLTEWGNIKQMLRDHAQLYEIQPICISHCNNTQMELMKNCVLLADLQH